MNHFINGQWTPSHSPDRITVTNPATGDVIDSVPAGDAAIRSAVTAFKPWRKTPTAQRAKLQHAAATKMRECADELAHLLTRELGRPLAGFKTEKESGR